MLFFALFSPPEFQGGLVRQEPGQSTERREPALHVFTIGDYEEFHRGFAIDIPYLR